MKYKQRMGLKKAKDHKNCNICIYFNNKLGCTLNVLEKEDKPDLSHIYKGENEKAEDLKGEGYSDKMPFILEITKEAET